LNFDVYLWQPGTKYVVFRTPKVAFSTPICFEDAFPDGVRQFVLNGAQIIMNISNDYWSLTPVEGMQHYINSLFRAVENRRPLLRATASGVTAYVDTAGRLVQRVPFYRQAYMIADVPIYVHQESFYTRYGDWFPKLATILFVILLFVAFSPRMRADRKA
jgi:apolipoprotein N-acyltransferase